MYFVRLSHEIFRCDEFKFKKIYKTVIQLFKSEITFVK